MGIVPHEPRHEKKKPQNFEVSISSYCTQQWTISWSDCDMWPVIWQPVMTSSVQSQICTKKRSRQSLFGGLLPVWSTAAFWIPAKPWHLKSMLSKLMRCTKNCNSCSRHWSTETAQFFSTTMAGCMSHTNTSKVERIGIRSLPHLPYSPDLSPTNHHFFRHLNNFLQGKCFHSQQETCNSFQELVESWGTDFYAKGKKIIDKSVLIVVVLTLINKDVLEPGYDDLNSQSERAITFLPT